MRAGYPVIAGAERASRRPPRWGDQAGTRMIIRVFEGTLKPGREQDFMAGERDLLTRRDIDGLVGVSIGRRLAGGATHVITLTVWRDQDALERFAHSGDDRPVFISGGEELVERWTLRHFEAVDPPATTGS